MRRSTLLLALAVGTATYGCDALSGPGENPPTSLDAVAITSMPQVGTTVTARVEVRDGDGELMSGQSVDWSASHGAVSPATSETDANGVASTSWTLGTVPGEQVVTARVGSLTPAEIRVTVRPGPVSEIVVSPASHTIRALGDTLVVEATASDQYGNETDVTAFTWTSSAPSVAEVTADGRVIAKAEGSATIEAAAGTAAATVDVVVDQVVMQLVVAGDLAVLAAAETTLLSATAVDSNGVAVDTAFTPIWATSNAAVATVDAAGLVTAVAGGSAEISATAGSLDGGFAVTVKDSPRPTIASISPAVLAAGDTAVITGTGFATTPSLNAVTVDGTAATVLIASATQLSAVVPTPAAGSCGPAGDVDVRVTVDELDAVASHPMSGAPQLALAVGGSATLTGADVACNELAEAGTYVVSVVNTTNSASATTAFRLRGTSAAVVADLLAGSGLAGSASRPALMAALDRDRVVLDEGRPPSPNPEIEAHLDVLEANLALGERLSADRRAAQAASPLSTRSYTTAAAAPALGAVQTLRIPDLDASGGFCSNYFEVQARVVYSGSRGVIFEDVASPLAGTMDDKFESFGMEYDSLMHEVLTTSFGDPLVYDDYLDDDDRVHMLFSPKVNEMERGVAGFVVSGDLFPRSQCAASDFREIFYGRVPMDAGEDFYEGYTANRWSWLMRATVIHEVKHITSFAHRLANNASTWEESWLEESTARISEELWARSHFGSVQNGNTGYDATIYCEVRPTTCGKPYAMAKHFDAVGEYYHSTRTLTPLGRANSADWTFYGSGWLFVRWAIDHSGMAEADVLAGLINATSLQGLANIEAVTGRAREDLLTEWSLAIALDDHPTAAGAPDTGAFPSWDTRDIFAGYNGDFPSSYPSLFPLTTRQLAGGTWDSEVPLLRGGSSYIYEIDAAAGQLVELLSATGGTAPSSLTLGIARIQ